MTSKKHGYTSLRLETPLFPANYPVHEKTQTWIVWPGNHPWRLALVEVLDGCLLEFNGRSQTGSEGRQSKYIEYGFCSTDRLK